jgi:HEAT repeat protein
MSDERIRLALRREATIDDLDRLAWKEDWALQNVIQATDDNPYEAVWLTEDGVEVHFLDDHLIDVPYLVLTGRGAAALAASLRGRLPVVEEGDVLRMDREAASDDERVAAVLVTGVLAGPHSPAEVVAILDRALRSPSADVRYAALMAAGYAERRELEPALRALLEDEDESIREDAAAALGALENVWREGPR